MSWLFGSKPKLTPKEQVREWSSGLKKEIRTLDRERAKIEREEQKTVIEIKKMAKQGHSAALKTMAKSLLKSQATRNRMLEASSRINSVILSLKTHMATMSVAEHMGKSVAVMRGMNSMLSVPELRETAKNMSKEMARAGMIEEMIDDSMESLDPADLDEEAEEEVDKVLDEVLQGTFGGVGRIKGKNTEKKAEEEEEVSRKQAADGAGRLLSVLLLLSVGRVSAAAHFFLCYSALFQVEDNADVEAMKARMEKLHQ